MLFVLGIYLLSGRARSVLWQVSAFTVAHSITLGLSMYGLVSVSPRIVEPMIALSIAYVAIENIFLSELKSWRVALVFAFGLLHGMGFAGALKELGLPRSEFVTALLTFNVGVEAGQLAVIGRRVPARRMALRRSRLVPQPHRRSRVGGRSRAPRSTGRSNACVSDRAIPQERTPQVAPTRVWNPTGT